MSGDNPSTCRPASTLTTLGLTSTATPIPHASANTLAHPQFGPLFFLSAPIALLFFNVGGEIGQLFFIAGVFAVVALARRVARPMAVTAPTWAWAVPPCFIGSVSAFWVFQRLAAF